MASETALTALSDTTGYLHSAGATPRRVQVGPRREDYPAVAEGVGVPDEFEE